MLWQVNVKVPLPCAVHNTPQEAYSVALAGAGLIITALVAVTPVTFTVCVLLFQSATANVGIVDGAVYVG